MSLDTTQPAIAAIIALVPQTGTAPGQVPIIPVPMASMSSPVRAAIDAITAQVAAGDYTGYFASLATQTYVVAQISTLTAGSPAQLNTFLEVYNQFLADESAAAGDKTALAAETTNRTAANTAEATLRLTGDTANAASVSAIATIVSGKEPSISSGTTLQYWRGDKTWQVFPAIPAAQVNSDWNSTTGLSQILNKPTLGTAAAQSASAFDAAGTAAAAVAALTAGSPAQLDTFVEAYNRFLTDESAASATNAAIASEATARAAADTSEAAARATADSALSSAIAAKQNAAVINAATLDFGYASSNEGDVATTTIPASWVTAASRIVCLPSPADSPDHSTEETLVEDIRFAAVNIIPNISFDVEAYAPNGTWGRHNCSIISF